MGVYFVTGGEDSFEVDRAGEVKTTGRPLAPSKEYTLTVQAVDSQGRRGPHASVFILAGFRPPQFTNTTYMIYIPESTGVGQAWVQEVLVGVFVCINMQKRFRICCSLEGKKRIVWTWPTPKLYVSSVAWNNSPGGIAEVERGGGGDRVNRGGCGREGEHRCIILSPGSEFESVFKFKYLLKETSG